MKIQENVSLAQYATFHLGGPARFYTEAASLEDLREAISFANEHTLPLHILGGGSNTLVSEAGFSGLVVHMVNQGLEVSAAENIVQFVVQAGEGWDTLVAYAVSQGAWGVENLSGIPGTVGGAVVQNIGAYGASLSETVTVVRAYNRATGSVEEFSNEACHFGYRESIFGQPGSPYVVLEAVFELQTGLHPNLSYKDLSQYFVGKNPGLEEIRNAILAIRKNKFPDLNVEGTAGSFFKNPIVGEEMAQALCARFPLLPTFALPEVSGRKIPLAWFLDERNGALTLPVRNVGDARLFEKQPLVIAAKNNTSANDVLLLATEVKKQIQEQLGIEVLFEVKII